MSEARNLETLHRARNAFNSPSHRNDYFALYDDTIRLYGYQGVEPGITGVKAFYAGFWAAFPDASLDFDDVFAGGDRVACRFRLTMTHKGEFNGIPPTGKQVTLTGITILRFENEKCVERWSQADFIGLMAQLTSAH